MNLLTLDFLVKFFPYILKTLWRHRSRTVLTVSGSAVALFVFCFVGSVQQGMDDLQRRQSAKRSLIAFQANKFCPATSHIPQDYEEKIRPIDGVRDVVPVQVYTNNCRASLDVIVFYGVPAKKIQRTRDFKLLEGTWTDFESDPASAILGRAVARSKRMRAGDTFELGDLNVKVAGVFASDDAAEENYIYSHLDFLQRRKSRNLVGTVTQFEVLLDPGADASAKCQEIDELFLSGPVQTNTRPKGVFQASSLGDLAQLIGMAHYLAFASVGLVLALVATTTVMSVEDRIKEHAVLQTIGFSGPRVFTLVVAESIILSAAGGLVGVAAALAVLQFNPMSVGAEGVTIAFTPSVRLAANGMLIALIAGVLAGLAPALHAARTEIVPALRHA